jgi:hypothetical protein
MQFIAERPAPDRYDWIIEGVLTDVDRAALLARLEARPPDLVLLLSGEGGDWPVLRARLHALDSEPLLDWVLARYRVATIGNDVAFLVPR